MRLGIQPLGPYDILEPVSVGGGGAVYRARDRRDNGIVALKVARTLQRRDVDALQREVRALQHVNRAQIPGIIRLIEASPLSSPPWYTMEWVSGLGLGAFTRRLWTQDAESGGADFAAKSTEDVQKTVDWRPGGDALCSGVDAARPGRIASDRKEHPQAARHSEAAPVKLQQAVGLVLKIATVLRDVHALGLLHGDLSPGNILLRDSGEPVLLDFGTAVTTFEPGLYRESSQIWVRGRGTPGYSAPEVLLGEPIDARADMYSLGCLAYELFTGRAPFVASSQDDLARQHLYVKVTAPTALQPALPAALECAVLSLLEKERGRRCAHAQSVIEILLDHVHPSEARVGLAAPRRVDVSLLRPSVHGRDSELRALESAWRGACARKGGLAIVRGHAGMGKTRLLNELALVAARDDGVVVVCNGAAVDSSSGATRLGSFEYLLPVVVHAARELLSADEHERASLSASIDPIFAVLAPYFPTDVWHGRELPPMPELDSENALRRVFDAMASLWRMLADRRGLLVLLDDLQSADALSHEFLANAAPSLKDCNVLALGAVRSDANPEFLQTILAGASLDLPIGRLDADCMRDIVQALLGTSELPEGLDDYVARHAEGNPFFVAEYLRFSLERRWLWLDARLGWRFLHEAARPGDREIVPQSIDALLSAKIAALSPEVREVCELASVLGQEFDEATLAELAPGNGQLIEPLRELVNTQILEPLTVGRYRFTHETIRILAERGLDPERLRSLHRSRALDIERRTQQAAESALLIAFHWSQANEHDRAGHYFELAARRACAGNAWDSACELYRRALRHVEIGDDPNRTAQAAALREHLGDALATRAKHDEARSMYAAALEQLNDSLSRARVQRKLAASYATLHEYTAARETLQRARREIDALQPSLSPAGWEELIEIELNLCDQLYFSQSTGPEFADLLVDMAARIDTWGNAKQRTYYYLTMAVQRLLARRYAFDARAVEEAWRGVEASRGLPQERRADAQFIHAFTLVFGSGAQREQALPLLEEAACDAEQAQATTLLSRIRTHYAITLLRLGHVERTRAAAERALQAASAARLPPYVAAATACLGWVAWRSARHGEARELLVRARDIWLSHAHPFPLRWIAGLPLLAIAQAEDDFELAATLLQDLLDPGQQALPSELQHAAEDAIAYCARNDWREASSAISRALHWAGKHHHC